MNPAVADAPALVRSGTRSYRRINWAFFAAGFVTFVTLYDLQPLLPAFAREYAVAPALASLPLSVATAALAVTMLFAGTLSETIGRKPVMVTALVASSLLALLTAASEGFAALLALRLCRGRSLPGCRRSPWPTLPKSWSRAPSPRPWGSISAATPSAA